MDETLVLPRRNADPDFGRGSVFFVGTATVIIRYAGFTILTDPNFLHAGDHVHLGYGLTAKRLTNPAVEMEDLPPLDFVLLSHLHGDHFDRVVQRRLNKATPIVSNKHATSYLKKVGFTKTRTLKTWEPLVVAKGEANLRVTALPGTHGPGPLGAVLPPVMGSMLEFGRVGEAARLRMYISGDTLVHDRLREIPRRFPGIDLAMLHLGGTRVLGVFVTMDAEQGLEAMRIMDARTTIPIHYNDYTRFESPLVDFERAVTDAGLDEKVRYLAHGETYEFEVPAAR
ncbi:MBL fold metallo-hydrolase [Rubrobacter tropicus]|uniref:MBL fold metallo-hydrolase n=1 Tax=Rubrobacter tropicus TaxID=2653851 RepID=A0A6G8QAM4_9ACTN|nr:MBL fold metallo-hydrolase [Rubrobacter tropicus]QIN83544.1 MBL fold metallo-hydrolase [Rubrobacter tropicus]